MTAPSILIQWSADHRAWVCTLVQPLDPQFITGPSSCAGLTPAQALDRVLSARLLVLTDQAQPATLIEIAPIHEPTVAEKAAMANPGGRC
jgi:hypothetical protein